MPHLQIWGKIYLEVRVTTGGSGWDQLYIIYVECKSQIQKTKSGFNNWIILKIFY